MTVKIDADNKILGRLATQVAMILQGKHKPTFQPHLITGEPVVIYNAEKIKVTGKKATQKKYYRHSGHIGHLKVLTYDKVFTRDPGRVIQHAVAGMLPKNRLRKEMLKRMQIVKGPIDAEQNQN